MRIKEVYIQRYGKLRPFNAKFEKNIGIVFGPGGSGKTFIIDAILMMLLGSGAREFIRHKELEEMPTGYIVIEEKGKEFILGEEKHLSDIPELKLDPIELKNIFVIEDADLEISDEDKFYGRVTGKLVGVRTADIQKIKESLRKRGRLTPTLKIASAHPYNVGKKLENARNLRSDVNKYCNEARIQGLGKLEEKTFNLRQNLTKLENSIELLDKAKEKSRFDRLESALKNAESSLQELKTLPDKDGISQLKSKLLNSEQAERKRPQFEREMRAWKERFKYLIISTVFTFAVVMAFGFGLLSTILPSILLLASFVSLYKWHQSDGALAQLETIKQSLVGDAQQIVGIKTKTYEEVSKEIVRISKEIEKKEEVFYEAKGILRDLQIDEENRERFVEKVQSELMQLRQSIDFNISIPYDETKLRKERDRQKSTKELLEKAEEQLQKHKKAIQDFSEKAQRLQFADEFSNFELNFEIGNIDSLEELVRWLDKYIENIKKDAELSKKALEIFEELESKEEAKSEELFGKGNLASRIFREITSGMFAEVSYDSSTREILVKRSHEKRLQKASELSRSEWTQLYMAIRVALGERLLKGEGGFFIVEEPFIHADYERLLKEFNMLKNLSERGWQAIYFTAKDEIKEGLPKQIDVDIIELKRLP